MSIELHTWDTPNGRKISVSLEEMGLTYTVHPVNIFKGEQFDPAFLKISPNNGIPAIVDPDGPGGGPISLFESPRAHSPIHRRPLSPGAQPAQ
jgi:GST-like protein